MIRTCLNQMIKIIPSILTNSPDEARELIEKCEGVAERAQIDIIDGKFVDNKTIDPVVFEVLETELKLDFHLMTKEPTDWVEKCVRGGADRVFGQIEMMESQIDFVGKIQEVGLSVGLAIDLGTPVTELDPVILTNLDAVLVMSVAAGFGGQAFDSRALDKIKKLDEIRVRDTTPFRICIDGGINKDNIREVVKAGADEVSIGKSLFNGELSQNIESLIKTAYKTK